MTKVKFYRISQSPWDLSWKSENLCRNIAFVAIQYFDMLENLIHMLTKKESFINIEKYLRISDTE
jgi:hypothetical protein